MTMCALYVYSHLRCTCQCPRQIPGSCYIKQWTDTAFIEMYTETIIFYLSYLQLLIMRSNLGIKTIKGALKVDLSSS